MMMNNVLPLSLPYFAADCPTNGPTYSDGNCTNVISSSSPSSSFTCPAGKCTTLGTNLISPPIYCCGGTTNIIISGGITSASCTLPVIFSSTSGYTVCIFRERLN